MSDATVLGKIRIPPNLWKNSGFVEDKICCTVLSALKTGKVLETVKLNDQVIRLIYFDNSEITVLFDKKNQIHNSVVLCKITNESPNAYLAFGSDDPDLYKQSDSKYFLLHLANLVGQSFIKFIKEV